MKILRLHFKNINSLQGENQLDFNQAPLVNAGVFAITGPNGSGKSSILDAITLALYGETFKFDRPSAHVMTRHTIDCFAEIEFQVHEIQYRCRWEVQREQASEEAAVSPAAMTLSKISAPETILATNITQVRERIASITGLNFRSFTRSTLLAQGDFAAFLNALDSERLDILEKIISSDIYAEYQQDIIQQAEQERTRLELLQADLAAIPLLSTATHEAYEHDLADFKAQMEDFEQAAQNLVQQMSSLQSLSEMDGQQQRILLQQQALQQQLQQINADLERLETAHAAQVLQAEVEAVISQQATLDEDRATLATYRQELALLQADLESFGDKLADPGRIIGKSVPEQQELIADLIFQTEQLHAESNEETALINALTTQLDDKQTEAQKAKTWLVEHTQDATLLENFPDLGQLKKLSTQIADLKQKQQSSAKVSQQTAAQFKSNQSGLQTLQKRIPELQKNLNLYESELKQLLKGHELAELNELRLEQQERVKDHRELLALARIQHRFKDGWLMRLGLIRAPQDPDTLTITQQLEELQHRLFTEENIKKTLEHAAFNETLLRKMQADRVHLANNEPCPLCGALKHPYAHKAPHIGDSNQALVDQTARVQSLNLNLTKVQQRLAAAQKQIQNKQLKADRLTRIQSEWAALCNRLNIASASLQIDNPKPIKKLLSKQVTDLKDIERVVKAVQQYQQKIDTVKTQLESQSAALVDLQGVMQVPDTIGINPPAESDTFNQALVQYQAEEKQLVEKITAQLAQFGEKMPTKSKKEEALFNRLNQRRQTYQTYLLRDKNLQEDILNLQQKINVCHNNIAVRTSRLQDSSARLCHEQGSGLHLAIIEKQKLIQEKELNITQLTAQLQSQQQALAIQASPFGIPSYADLVKTLQLLPRQTELEQQHINLAAQLRQLDVDLQNILDHKQSVATSLQGETSLPACEAEHHSLLEKMDISQLEIQRLEEALAQQQTRQEKASLLLDNIIEQQARLALANTELQLLNADQGHTFRRTVQRKTADKLLSKTNQILEKISGRFYIRRGDNEQGLALEVEDTFQNNTRRLPKTLSGGESFVVSLALALGLSELASNGQAIESLFLDEGFGNLDAEALYTVITTLENLQTQGKKIGVISHVEGLRKRIKTQIEMVKKPNGLSEFKLLA